MTTLDSATLLMRTGPLAMWQRQTPGQPRSFPRTWVRILPKTSSEPKDVGSG